MRILLINKYAYLKSGTERYLFNLKALLEKHDHEAELFAMQDPQNEASRYAAAFPPAIDFYKTGAWGKVQAAGRVIWYCEAARRLAAVLDDFRPDVVHLFNIYHQLSPALIPEIARRGIPIVHTLNDYKLICPNYLLYTENAPCTRCLSGRYHHAIRHRCLHNSLAWSALATVEMTLHKTWQVYEKHVRTFVAPSHFLHQKLLEAGIPATQIRHIPYFLNADDLTPSSYHPGAPSSPYLAYFGRLSPEKGLETLLRAMALVPEAQLWLIGDGPLRPRLDTLVSALPLANVRFTGYLRGATLWSTVAQAQFTVLPAEWYELFGQTIIESLALGVPVIASATGGIPELIRQGETGLLFPPGDVVACADAIRFLWHNSLTRQEMGERGRGWARTTFAPEPHYQAILSLYNLD